MPEKKLNAAVVMPHEPGVPLEECPINPARRRPRTISLAARHWNGNTSLSPDRS